MKTTKQKQLQINLNVYNQICEAYNQTIEQLLPAINRLKIPFKTLKHEKELFGFRYNKASEKLLQVEEKHYQLGYNLNDKCTIIYNTFTGSFTHWHIFAMKKRFEKIIPKKHHWYYIKHQSAKKQAA